MTSKNTHTDGKKPTAQRTVVLKNPLLVSLVKQKEEMVLEGRAKSKELEQISQRIVELQEKEKEYTSQVEPTELLEKGKALQEEINQKINELEQISESIKKEKLGNIPKEIVDEHLQLNKDREKLEKELNKIGLKIEKFKAKYVPKIQKLVKPELQNEYEDLETSELVGDEIHVKIFSHLEDFKTRFHARKNT